MKKQCKVCSREQFKNGWCEAHHQKVSFLSRKLKQKEERENDRENELEDKAFYEAATKRKENRARIAEFFMGRLMDNLISIERYQYAGATMESHCMSYVVLSYQMADEMIKRGNQ